MLAGLIIACIGLAFIAFVSWKAFFALKSEYRALKNELEKQKRNSAYLATYAAEMARIERSNNELKKDLRRAKTDEEIADIISTVIDCNNKRVPNDAGK